MDEINYLQWMRVVNFDNDLLIAEYASILGLNFEENHFYETLIHPIEEIPGSSGMWKIQFSGLDIQPFFHSISKKTPVCN